MKLPFFKRCNQSRQLLSQRYLVWQDHSDCYTVPVTYIDIRAIFLKIKCLGSMMSFFLPWHACLPSGCMPIYWPFKPWRASQCMRGILQDSALQITQTKHRTVNRIQQYSRVFNSIQQYSTVFNSKTWNRPKKFQGLQVHFTK